MIDASEIIPLDIHDGQIADAVCQGAHYDAHSGVWYVEPHELTDALRNFAYDAVDFNIVAPYYLVITSKVQCSSCRQPTDIIAVMFTRYLKKSQDGRRWLSVTGNSFLFHINQLPEAIRKNIKAKNYYPDKSKTSGLRYWMNHCEVCGERLSDYALFCVEEDLFKRMPVERLLKADIRKVKRMFVCQAGNPADDSRPCPVNFTCEARFRLRGPR
ncbi:hypothetical protein [Citrobacter rodentium]|uniref:DNA primase n=2 Tax=Citrobacter rodentium TaxID=67825 RepID=D2TJY4_CITRI|nr:hypothetical protein [Citrobacter rodentium]KIQ51175.1 DNA primase [Citrobacter rodentium]QBY31563.1 DNA primase [Citrobacter rodentium]UHO31080.1 DNA primase [Citrobacter rodentium NBRC 105723 = DSM 16636]CBG87112.1 hypothetical protein ROD_03301 [Citrobacter rodentium ICC168]HAT8014144.1 DNA primase [Citrobacter rodentium NBRC 105723 = DSM 16636]